MPTRRWSRRRRRRASTPASATPGSSPSPSEFDAVFTNAALHWVGAPAQVTAGVAKALKPGGRYVGEFGGFGNIAAIRVAIRAVLVAHGYRIEPYETSYYPTAEAFRAVLEAGGFEVLACDIIPRPTPLPSGMSAWLNTFRGGFIDAAGVPPEKRVPDHRRRPRHAAPGAGR